MTLATPHAGRQYERAAFQMIEGVPTYNLFIGGEWVPSSRNEATASHNPATGEIYAKVHQAGARETEQAIAAAHGAYRDWAEKSFPSVKRYSCAPPTCLPPSQRHRRRSDPGIRFGRRQSRVRSRLLFRFAAHGRLGVAPLSRRDDGDDQPGQFGFTIRQPLGVIAGIAPFNAPFLLAMKKVVLALAAGNGFVLKPSELTPVTGLKIAEVFAEAGLPKGLLSVIPGPAAEIGRQSSPIRACAW